MGVMLNMSNIYGYYTEGDDVIAGVVITKDSFKQKLKYSPYAKLIKPSKVYNQEATDMVKIKKLFKRAHLDCKYYNYYGVQIIVEIGGEGMEQLNCQYFMASLGYVLQEEIPKTEEDEYWMHCGAYYESKQIYVKDESTSDFMELIERGSDSLISD